MSNNTGDLVSRIYGGFRGVDFRGEEINIVRSPDSLNVWKDYKETDSIRTRPGMELQTAFDDPVYGIFFYNDMQLIHSGTKLYKVKDGKKAVLCSGLREGLSNGFTHENKWYFKDGKHYLVYDGDEAPKEVEGHVPTTSIGRNPNGGGKTLEDANMLNGIRINTFLADGASHDFYLDTFGIDEDDTEEDGFKVTVYVDDEEYDRSKYTVDRAKGVIKINGDEPAPGRPKTDGQDNVKVVFRKTIPGYRESILKCTLLQVFDNRVFFSGNDEYPNVIWHTSLNDPTYVSDLDYYREGLDSAKVRGLVAGNNALWVFREPSQANTTVFYHTPTLDAEYGKIYPSTHSSITTGCVGKAVNFNDDIVFFSDRGMEGISGDVTTEQAVAHRSSLVDRKMLAEAGYKDMVLEEWEGYLFIFIGDKAYLADSRTAFKNENHTEYEFFYWDLEKKVTCSQVCQGVLYLGTEDGVYTMTDFDCDVESYWTTPLDKFGSPNKVKTTSKRGCVVEAEGDDIQVYVKTNREDWAFIDTFNDVEDAFICRIKKKKFKDLQMKFYSTKRFSLETATLEAYIGGFVKRL